MWWKNLTLQKQLLKADSLAINTIQVDGMDQIIDRISYYIPTEESLKSVSIELRTKLKLDNDGSFVTNAAFVE